MSDDSRAGRMAVRFTDEDKDWLAQHAADEGVEPATLVRMIVHRLRLGRVPLMSMVGMPARPAAVASVRIPVGGEMVAIPGSEPQHDEGTATAEEVLQARLAELDGGEVVQLHAEPDTETAAIPLRRVARNQYNPGRN